MFANINFAAVIFDQLIVDIENKYIEKVMQDHPVLVTDDIKVEVFNQDLLKNLPDDILYYKFKFKKKSDVLGKTILPLYFYDIFNREILKRELATEVTARAYFVKVKSLVKGGRIIKKEQVEKVYLDYKGHSDRSYRRIEDVVGQEAVSTIATDTVLAEWMLRRVPVIQKGDSIHLLVTNKGLTLTMKGKALDDGGIGDTIRVQSSFQSKKILEGEVVNETTVRVHILY